MPKRDGNDEVKNLFLDAGAQVIEETHIRPFNGVNGCRCDSLKARIHAALAALPTTLATRRLVRRLKPDLVHINTSVLPFAALGAKLSWMGAPIVVHVRESALKNRWGRLLSFFNRQFTDWFVGIDQSGLDRIGDLSDRSTVIHNSVDTSDINFCQSSVNKLRQSFNCKDDSVLFVSACRISRSNGSLEFAKFISEHKLKIPTNVRFVFCGFHENSDNEYVNATRKAIAEDDSVFAMNFTKEIGDLIHASDVVMAPFTSAHSARVVIEGASLGKPALVTDFSNLREQISVDETGFVFRFDQPETLIAAINQFANRQKTKEMGDAARQFAEQNFSLNKNVTRMEDFYMKIFAQI